MTVYLNARQKKILEALILKNSVAEQQLLQRFARDDLSSSEVERLCALVNYEFMAEGLLPSFEPNEYGIELEELMDIVNRSRISP